MKHLLAEQVGSSWTSCKNWKASGGTGYWNGQDGRPKITVSMNDAGMHLHYVGPGSGYAISHAKNGKGDSLHQAFNVVVCEVNPFLYKGGLKPNINAIESNCVKNDKTYDMNIWIPFVAVDASQIYQLNHRGGWGHDPGPNAVKQAVGSAKNLEGPGRVVVNTGGGIITEYFVTYTV